MTDRLAEAPQRAVEKIIPYDQYFTHRALSREEAERIGEFLHEWEISTYEEPTRDGMELKAWVFSKETSGGTARLYIESSGMVIFTIGYQSPLYFQSIRRQLGTIELNPDEHTITIGKSWDGQYQISSGGQTHEMTSINGMRVRIELSYFPDPQE